MTLYLGDKQIAGTLKGEINNPYSLLESKYSELEITNSSWLKSNGQWNTKTMYPSAYEEVKRIGKEKGQTYYAWLPDRSMSPNTHYTLNKEPQIGEDIYVYHNGNYILADAVESVASETMIYSRYTGSMVRDESKDRVTYTDYDFVYNETDETFRLPLLNGSEDLVGDEIGQNFDIQPTGSQYIANYNGNISFCATTNATNVRIQLYNKSNEISDDSFANNSGEVVAVSIPVKKGDILELHYGSIKTFGSQTYDRFYLTKSVGNGDLYYYVGDTIQNASLIDVSQVTSQLANKVDVSNPIVKAPYLKETYMVGTSGYNIWSNGYCEQWGYDDTTTKNVTVTLTKRYRDMNYSILHAYHHTSYGSYVNGYNPTSNNTFTINKYDTNVARKSYWKTCGYLAEGEY